MIPLSIRTNIQTLFIVFVLSFANAEDRKINSTINPGCLRCSAQQTLIYIKATGPHDTVHQIWDFTRGTPTMIFTIADVNSTYRFWWYDNSPEHFILEGTASYSFGAALEELVEFNDIADRGHIEPSDDQYARPLSKVSWRRNYTVLSDKEAYVAMRGRFKDDGRGRIQIKLDLLPFKDYAVDLPHLIHTANSTLVDVNLVNLTTNSAYNASRFAVRLRLASTDPDGENMMFNMRKTLDDEHTPGIFEIMELKTPRSFRSGDGGFVQFRPVAYTQPLRDVASSTIVHVSSFDNSTLSTRSTLGRFFAISRPLVQDVLISFGEPGDGFYVKHNYTAWSYTIGYGAPPLEGFSLFVIIIISIGLGVPVLLAGSGITYVLVRRYKQRNTPARLFDDE